MSRKPKSAVRAAVDKAVETEAGEVDAARQSGPDWLRKRFKLKEDGLYLVRDENLHWICARFDIEAETRDDAGNWGVLISWRDRDGAQRSEIFGRELLAGDCREVRNRLAAGGLTIAGDPRSRQALVDYLNIVKAQARARCVDRMGWHIIDGKRVFVLPPDVTIGEPLERVILQNLGKERAPFGRSGTLASWKETIGTFCTMNSLLTFSVSAAFAGALLDLADQDGGGINLKGASRVGKTTALRVAASVWGGTAEQGAAAFIRSWRATGNGLESVATQHSDTLLCLDEMGQSDSSEIGDIAYMLSNGSGKSRATRDGGARAAARWRVLFLSTGEMGLAEKNAEAKRQTKAGMEVRLLDISADAGAGYGLFEHLHGNPSADRFAEALRLACRANFGTAGRAFLQWMLEQIEHDVEFMTNMRGHIEVLVADFLANLRDVGGQVKSVARRFALVAVAGELAGDAGVTGWEKGEATDAAKIVFKAWLAERGTTGASEDLKAKQRLSDFIGRFGAGRFDLWGKLVRNEDGEVVHEESALIERNKTVIRAGWRRVVDREGTPSFDFYLLDDAMREALSGLDFKSAIRTLTECGMIAKDGEGKSKTPCKPPGVGKLVRLYVVPGHVIGLDEAFQRA